MSTAVVYEMNIQFINFSLKVRKHIQPCRYPLMIVFMDPVVDEFLLIGEGYTLRPVLNRFGIWEAGAFEPRG